MRRRIPRTKGALTGFLIIALGVWAGLIAFVGPYFDFQIGTTDTWDWSANRLYLEVLPAAAAVLGGLMLIGAVTRASASLGGWLALAAGAWFLIGPTMSMLWENGNLGTGAAIGDTGTRVGEWIGFFYGPGALITALAAYALGRFMAPAVVPATQPTAAPAATDEPRRRTYRRRLPFRRTRDQREVETTPRG
jgi:hypothetical protein